MKKCLRHGCNTCARADHAARALRQIFNLQIAFIVHVKKFIFWNNCRELRQIDFFFISGRESRQERNSFKMRTSIQDTGVKLSSSSGFRLTLAVESSEPNFTLGLKAPTSPRRGFKDFPAPILTFLLFNPVI